MTNDNSDNIWTNFPKQNLNQFSLICVKTKKCKTESINDFELILI